MKVYPELSLSVEQKVLTVAINCCRFSPQSIQIIDISSSVFPGFADWVQRHCDTFQGVYTPDDSASFVSPSPSASSRIVGFCCRAEVH